MRHRQATSKDSSRQATSKDSYARQDNYARQAQRAGYAARSAFKLAQINDKYHLFKNGMRVLDLGCAPGSWCQYVAQQVGIEGTVVGIDRNPVKIKLLPQITCHQADINSEEIKSIIQSPFDVVLSDMAPNTSGIATADAARSQQLAETVLEIATSWLKPNGALLLKVFQGKELPNFYAHFRQCFVKSHIVKPKSSRPQSVEIFLLGIKWQFPPKSARLPCP